jgi:hypothetical protein
MEEYRAERAQIKEVVDDFDEVGKLGLGFDSVDRLEEVNLGENGESRPTYINRGLPEEHKRMMKELLREFSDCFT